MAQVSPYRPALLGASFSAADDQLSFHQQFHDRLTGIFARDAHHSLPRAFSLRRASPSQRPHSVGDQRQRQQQQDQERESPQTYRSDCSAKLPPQWEEFNHRLDTIHEAWREKERRGPLISPARNSTTSTTATSSSLSSHTENAATLAPPPPLPAPRVGSRSSSATTTMTSDAPYSQGHTRYQYGTSTSRGTPHQHQQERATATRMTTARPSMMDRLQWLSHTSEADAAEVAALLREVEEALGTEEEEEEKGRGGGSSEVYQGQLGCVEEYDKDSSNEREAGRYSGKNSGAFLSSTCGKRHMQKRQHHEASAHRHRSFSSCADCIRRGGGAAPHPQVWLPSNRYSSSSALPSNATRLTPSDEQAWYTTYCAWMDYYKHLHQLMDPERACVAQPSRHTCRRHGEIGGQNLSRSHPGVCARHRHIHESRYKQQALEREMCHRDARHGGQQQSASSTRAVMDETADSVWSTLEELRRNYEVLASQVKTLQSPVLQRAQPRKENSSLYPSSRAAAGAGAPPPPSTSSASSIQQQRVRNGVNAATAPKSRSSGASSSVSSARGSRISASSQNRRSVDTNHGEPQSVYARKRQELANSKAAWRH